MPTAPYAARRERVLERLGGGVLLVPSARVARRNGDSEYAYRQESDFLYLTGFHEPESVLVLAPRAAKRVTLFVRPRNRDEETWTGRRAGVEGAVAQFGADQAFPIDQLEKELPNLLLNAHTLYYPLGLDRELDGRVLPVLTATREKQRTGVPVPDRIAEPAAIVHELRIRKDPGELAILRRAVELTTRGFERALRATRPGVHEYELEAELIYEFRKGGGAGPGYEPIVAAGRNATILHYPTGKDVLKDGELVLIDCGCEVDGYTADVTRTWPAAPEFSAPQRELYDVVLAAHATAIATVRPGSSREAVHEAASRELIRGLVRLGLLQGEEDALWLDKSNKSYRRFYMHGTSHWLGLDVHDVGPYWRGGTPRPLAPGMVLTVEPGLYVAEDDFSAPERFRGIGIRVEDDVLVTATGHEVLTAAIPRTPEEISRARRQA